MPQRFSSFVPSNFCRHFPCARLPRLDPVNKETALAADCRALADEVEMALSLRRLQPSPIRYHYTFGLMVSGNHLLMDDIFF